MTSECPDDISVFEKAHPPQPSLFVQSGSNVPIAAVVMVKITKDADTHSAAGSSSTVVDRIYFCRVLLLSAKTVQTRNKMAVTKE